MSLQKATFVKKDFFKICSIGEVVIYKNHPRHYSLNFCYHRALAVTLASWFYACGWLSDQSFFASLFVRYFHEVVLKRKNREQEAKVDVSSRDSAS